MEFVATHSDPPLVAIPDNPGGGQQWKLSNGRKDGIIEVVFRGQYVWLLMPGETVIIWFEHLQHKTLSPAENLKVKWQTKALLALEPHDKSKQHVLWSSTTFLQPCGEV